jgi:hypothetical protein
VNQSIIQTAVINKSLRLELDYRQPSLPLEGDASIEGPTTDTGLALQDNDSQVSDEFACLLRVI